MLIGVGYDAYCVYGKAPREITTKNESLMECLFLDKGVYVETDDRKPKQNNDKNEYSINKRPVAFSKWDHNQKRKEIEKEEEKRRIALTINDDEPDELLEGILIACGFLVCVCVFISFHSPLPAIRSLLGTENPLLGVAPKWQARCDSEYFH